ncbi:MAG TPA: hypothetical protein PLA68_15930 [Panacibacter sp.]|nr:hypothetical protein [Panacibacter sp.]
MIVIFISHDLGVVCEIADIINVIYKGKITAYNNAVNGVSFEIYKGETLGLQRHYR